MNRVLKQFLAGMLVCTFMSGCAEQIQTEDGHAYDPLENVNRNIYGFNTYADENAIEPTAKAYRDYVPDPVRTGIHDALQNLGTPVVFANEVLQGDVEGAGTSFARFMINSTVGLGGLLDAGAKAGLQPQDTGFGHTLAVYGVGHGPYLVLPLIGPSTPREVVGFGADSYSDPITFFITTGASVAKGAVDAIDQRSRYIDQVDELRRGSVDEYATVRSVYLQRLEANDRAGSDEPNSGGTAEIPDYADPGTGQTR
jgi:phospholipid-binding lipoprotein MlaA